MKSLIKPLKNKLVKLTDKIKFILTDTKGESLMESIISLLLLSVMLLSIMVMVSVCLRISGNSVAEANELRKEENEAALGIETESAVIKFEISEEGGGIPDEVELEVNLFRGDSFISFAPAEVPES